jgi:hypothetical protein
MRDAYWWMQFYILVSFSPFRWRLSAELGVYRQYTIEFGPFAFVAGWPSFAAELPKDEME